jgi:hypothetical protein
MNIDPNIIPLSVIWGYDGKNFYKRENNSLLWEKSNTIPPIKNQVLIKTKEFEKRIKHCYYSGINLLTLDIWNTHRINDKQLSKFNKKELCQLISQDLSYQFPTDEKFEYELQQRDEIYEHKNRKSLKILKEYNWGDLSYIFNNKESKQAWKNYTSITYGAINEYLRYPQQEPEDIDMISGGMKGLLNELRYMKDINPVKTPSNIILYRGSSPPKKEHRNIINNLKVGDIMFEDAFLSSSVTIDTAVGFTNDYNEKRICCLFRLIVPKDVYVMPIYKIFDNMLQPDEVVILPQTQWKIVDISYMYSQKHKYLETKVITVVFKNQKLFRNFI